MSLVLQEFTYCQLCSVILIFQVLEAFASWLRLRHGYALFFAVLSPVLFRTKARLDYKYSLRVHQVVNCFNIWVIDFVLYRLDTELSLSDSLLLVSTCYP